MSTHVPAPRQGLSSYSSRGVSDAAAAGIPSSGLGSQVRANSATQTCLFTTARWDTVRLFPARYSIPGFWGGIPCCTCQILSSHNSDGLLRKFLRRVLFDTQFLWSQEMPTTPAESTHPTVNSSPPMWPPLPAIGDVVANPQCLTGNQDQ